MQNSFLPQQKYQIASFISCGDSSDSARNQANAFLQTIPGSDVIKVTMKMEPHNNNFVYVYMIEYKK